MVCGCADWAGVLRDSDLHRAVEDARELDGGFLQDEGTDGCVHGEVQKGARGEMNNARRREIEKLQALMKVASANLDFERCIEIRDTIAQLKRKMRAK